MVHSFKPQKFLSILLAVLIIFAVNAPVLLQRGGALFPIEEDTDYSEPEDPVTEPEPVSQWTEPSTEPYNPWSDYTDDEPDTYPTYIPPVTEDPDDPDDPVTQAPVTQAPVTQTPQTNAPVTYQPPTQPAVTAVPETTTAAAIPSAIAKYAAVQEYFTDTQLDDQNIASTEKDQNAIHIGGGNVIVNNAIISRINAASKESENALHYGVGSVILATNGTGFISKTNINSEANAATGAFAYGSAKIYMADTDVTTALNGAHGLETAETGKLYAWNMNVHTLGNGSSPVYTGPGGGTFVLDGGSYVSSGLKSPAVRCAGDVALANADFTAEQSEAAVVENGSTLTVTGSNLTGDMRVSEDHSFLWTVLLYQNGTKDPAVSTNFHMKDGSVVSKGGGMFYVTNTAGNIYLENVTLKPFKNSDFLLRCTGNADKVTWGTPNNNGAVCNLTAVKQQLEGNIVWDRLSEVSLYVKDGSGFTGAFLRDDTHKTGKGFADLYLGEGCTWTVAGDSVLSRLYNAGTITDTSGNTVTVKKADGTVIMGGTSAYSIVVDAYHEKADLSGAQKSPDWTKTSVVRPAALGASLAEITTEEITEPSTTPSKPDAVYEKRKQLAIYVLIGVGAVIVASAVVLIYQANKYKFKKIIHKQS